MTDGVSGPYDEIDSVSDIVVDPLKGSVDEGYGRVTVCGLGAKDASRAITSMAG